jgi:hypothetical protein
MADDKQLLNRFRYVVAEQIKAIDQLKAENERLQAIIAQSADAMIYLQAIYTDETIKPEIRAAVAKAARLSTTKGLGPSLRQRDQPRAAP